MGSIGRYIMRTMFGAFALVLVSLTTVIWVTHILRDIDIITNQGQTVLIFIGMTALLIPALMLIIAPIALMIATAYTLNKLNSDSEIIVMNAAGLSPWRIFRPFLAVSLIVAVMVAIISAYVAPKCLRELRILVTKIRADLIQNIIQPGRFTSFHGGRLAFSIRERRQNGELVGIFIDDRRDDADHVTVLAERGLIMENETGTFLVLTNGTVQRQETKQRDPTIVLFERYAFNMTEFTGAGRSPTFNATERYLWDLFAPDPEDPYVKAQSGRIRAEFHDRLMSPFYPIAFVVLAFAILGAPRTTRQSRGLSMFMAILAVTVLRLTGFSSVVFGVKTPGALALIYVGLAVAFALGLLMISRGAIVEPPAFILRAVEGLQARLSRLLPGREKTA